MDAEEMKKIMQENNAFRLSDDRYKKLEYRRAGKSGLKLSEVSMGLWQNFGSNNVYEVMRNLILTAFDGGVTVFDIANNYGPVAGAAERNFGSILARDLASHRDELIVTTKAGYGAWRGPYGEGNGGRKHLFASLDRSLKNLGVEYVDIFYHHRPDPDTPIEETCYALKQMVDAGKVLYIGISNYTCEQTKAAVACLRELKAPFVLSQMSYSIFDRSVETSGLKAFAHENGFALTAYSPLAQGLLTDRYRNGIPEGSRMSRNGFLKKDRLTEETVRKIDALRGIAQNRGQTLAAMALSWVLKDEDVASVIIGASSAAQIRENLQLNTSFTQEELAAIDAASL